MCYYSSYKRSQSCMIVEHKWPIFGTFVACKHCLKQHKSVYLRIQTTLKFLISEFSSKLLIHIHKYVLPPNRRVYASFFIGGGIDSVSHAPDKEINAILRSKHVGPNRQTFRSFVYRTSNHMIAKLVPNCRLKIRCMMYYLMDMHGLDASKIATHITHLPKWTKRFQENYICV